jgi:hypothetical protein
MSSPQIPLEIYHGWIFFNSDLRNSQNMHEVQVLFFQPYHRINVCKRRLFLSASFYMYIEQRRNFALFCCIIRKSHSSRDPISRLHKAYNYLISWLRLRQVFRYLQHQPMASKLKIFLPAYLYLLCSYNKSNPMCQSTPLNTTSLFPLKPSPFTLSSITQTGDTVLALQWRPPPCPSPHPTLPER